MFSKPELKQLLAEGKIEQAIEALQGITLTLSGATFANEVTLLSFRFEQNKSQERQETVAREELNRYANQICAALLGLIDRLPNPHVDFPVVTTPAPSLPAKAIKLRTLARELKSASSAILRWENRLSVIEEHIKRQIVEKILDWISNPIETKPDSKEEDVKPIAVVHGGPGVGKSVIMRELCERLQKEGIPTLGIRSELYQAENFELLQKSLNFSNDIVETIGAIASKHSLVVVLIDQIDALSQSFSANRIFLDTYHQLIWELADLENVRVIISSRTFDLNNDPALKEYAKSSSFEVLPLERAQVESILSKLGVASTSLHPDLFEILSIPNNLNVFCKVYRTTTKLSQLQTLQDLYSELWQQAIERLEQLEKTDPATVSNLAEEIARKMNEEQRLSLPKASLLFDRKRKELRWLTKEGILLESKEKKEVQFFHQTFYEYLFAKQFVQNKKDLLCFIHENHQGLSCRASVKLILQFYRDFDNKAYLSWLRAFLFGNEVRFHFKHLALSILANQVIPTELEKTFVMQEILPHKQMGFLFLQLTTSHDWILFFLENKITYQLAFPEEKRADGLVIQVPNISGQGVAGSARRRLRAMLYEFIKAHPQSVLAFYKELPEFEEKPEIVTSALYMLDDWSYPEAIQLFEQYYEAIKKQDSFLLFSILEHATQQQFDWVLEKFYPYLVRDEDSLMVERTDGSFSYQVNQLTELIFRHDRHRAFDFYLEALLKILDKKREHLSEARKHFQWSAWFDSDPDDEFFGSSGSEMIFKKLVEEARYYAVNQPEKFMQFFKAHYKSRWSDILKLILHGIAVNPESYVDETLILANTIYKKGGFQSPQLDNTRYLLRTVLKKNVHLMSAAQWKTLKEMLLTLLRKNDAWIDNRSTSGKKQFKGYYGHELLLYLQCLPKEILKKDPDLWRKYHEFNRRYGEIKDREIGGGGAYSVPPPLKQSAYEKMSPKQWECSFRKYNKDFKRDFWSRRGDSYQHRSEFQKYVKDNPSKFLGLVENLIQDESFDFMYVSAGLDGLREAMIDTPTFTRVLKMAINRKVDNRYDINHLIRQMRFFAGQRPCDPDLLDWLESLILCGKIPEIIFKTGNDEASKKDSPFAALGSIVSEAVYEWIHLYGCKEHKERIFSVLNKAVVYPWQEVRLSIIRAIPYLLNLDKKDALNLYARTVEKREEKVIDECFYSLQKYFIWIDFEALLPFLRDLAQFESRQPDVAFTLAVQWIEGKDAAWEVLKPILDANQKAVAKMPEVALRKLKENQEHLLQRCQLLFEMYLEHPADEVGKAYNHSLHRLKPKHFQLALPILRSYKNAKATKKIPAAFFECLRLSASRFPEDVIELMDLWKHCDDPDIFHEYYGYRDDPMSILVSVYKLFSRLPEKNKEQVNKILDMVDKILMMDFSNKNIGEGRNWLLRALQMRPRPYLPLHSRHLHLLPHHRQFPLQKRLLLRQELLRGNHGGIVVSLDEHEQLSVNLLYLAHGFEFEQKQGVAVQQAVEFAVGFFDVKRGAGRDAFAFCAEVAVATAGV
jgi:hypothetical protein